MIRKLLLTTVLVINLGACASCSKAKKGQDGVVGGGTGKGGKDGGMKVGPVPSFPAGATPESYDDETFTVMYAAAAGDNGGQIVVQVMPKKPYHLNHEYPTELELAAPDGITLTQTLYENNPDKQEAAAWMDDVGAFAVKFGVKDKTALDGKKVDVKFRFAVCTDVSCDPKSAEFAMPIVTP